MTSVLRPVTEADLSLLVGDDAGFDFFGPRPSRSTLPSPDLNEPGGGFAILDAEGQVAGNVSWVWLQWGPNPQSRNPMIGIWVAEHARGAGLGSEAQATLVDLFFRHTTTNRVEAQTDVNNRAERRSLEKVGFSCEGTIRGAQWRDGAWHDLAQYSIVRDEWEKRETWG